MRLCRSPRAKAKSREKGLKVWAGFAVSGFFGCAIREGANCFAQDDRVFGRASSFREVVGVEGGELAAEAFEIVGFGGDGGEGGVDVGFVGRVGVDGEFFVLVGEVDGLE